MNHTQNDRLKQVTSDTLIVGVDVGSQTHFCRAFDWRGLLFQAIYGLFAYCCIINSSGCLPNNSSVSSYGKKEKDAVIIHNLVRRYEL